MASQIKTKPILLLTLALSAVSMIALSFYAILHFSQNTNISQALGFHETVLVLFTVHLSYMLLIFPFLYKKLIMTGSVIGSVIFSIALASLILTTGGFSSPYFGLWILYIVGVSIFNRSMPFSLVAISTIYFFGNFLEAEFSVDFVKHSIIPLASLYLAAGFGYWIWRSQHIQLDTSKNLNAISSKLSQEQLKAEILLRDVGDGVIVIDTNNLIQLLNPAGAKLTGWLPDEGVKLDYKIVMHLSTESSVPLTEQNNPFVLAINQKKSIIRDDLILTSHSGKKIIISLIVSPIFNALDSVSGAIGIFRDISSEKATARQRDEFISTASHEMRTPVAAIDGYLSLALNQKVAQIDEKARFYLQKAQESTSHLGKLFQDLLTTTKLEDGRIQSRPEVVELNKIIQEVLDELRFKAESKKISLSLSSGLTSVDAKVVKPLYYVYVDGGQLREVISNLIDNAIKFTPEGSVTITIAANDYSVTLGVHDTGLGIAPEDQPHLFQKFYRVDSSKTRTIGGTGLGLYISRTIIELFNGRIWVESKLNEGSHFYISLPRLNNQQVQSLTQQLSANTNIPQNRSVEIKIPQPVVAPTEPLQVK